MMTASSGPAICTTQSFGQKVDSRRNSVSTVTKGCFESRSQTAARSLLEVTRSMHFFRWPVLRAVAIRKTGPRYPYSHCGEFYSADLIAALQEFVRFLFVADGNFKIFHQPICERIDPAVNGKGLAAFPCRLHDHVA